MSKFFGAAFLFIAILLNTGCGTQSLATMASPSPTPATAPRTYAVYASTYPYDFLPAGIFAFHVDGGPGIAAPISGSPFAAPHGIAKFMVSGQNNILFANTFDSIDFTTDRYGPDRGIYTLAIAADGSLSAPVQLDHTYFPATLSPNSNFMYRSESNDESFGLPLALTEYSVDPATGNLSPTTIAPQIMNGQESFEGQLLTDPNGIWMKVGIPNTAVGNFQHFQVNPITGQISRDPQMVTGAVDMYSHTLAASQNFLVALDGTANLQNMVHFWTIRDSSIVSLTDMTDCIRGTCPNIGASAAIHPSQHFAFLFDGNAILTVPLSLSTGPDFSNAKSTVLPISRFSLGGTLAISADGQILAVGRFQELDIFKVSADGSLTPVQGSPFQTPLTAPPALQVVELPQ